MVNSILAFTQSLANFQDDAGTVKWCVRNTKKNVLGFKINGGTPVYPWYPRGSRGMGNNEIVSDHSFSYI
jgi:hypothetical protein